MPSYNVTVELLIDAESKDRAWEICHALTYRMRRPFPWRRHPVLRTMCLATDPIINEPEEVPS